MPCVYHSPLEAISREWDETSNLIVFGHLRLRVQKTLMSACTESQRGLMSRTEELHCINGLQEENPVTISSKNPQTNSPDTDGTSDDSVIEYCRSLC
jgi:hypothetical protein